MTEIGRNDPCPCGSGKKYKKCCAQKSKMERRAFAPVDVSDSPPSISHITSMVSKTLRAHTPKTPTEGLEKKVHHGPPKKEGTDQKT